jgi:hypothetical protein
MSEYADEIAYEKQDWTDSDDASEYDDPDLAEIRRRKHVWKSRKS